MSKRTIQTVGLIAAPFTAGTSLLLTGVPGHGTGFGNQGLLGMIGSAYNKGGATPALANPQPPDPAAIAKQAALDNQKRLQAESSPSDITNVRGGEGIPTTTLLGTDPSLTRNMLKGL